MSGYGAASALVDAPGGPRLGLETATALTPSGLMERPVFFAGFPSRPDVVAAGLLAVADVAASRYADAGLMQRVANLDPVVTASGDRLRFESFSACNSVHARLDLLPAGIDEGEIGFGTTNVDINQPLRSALAGLGSRALLHLTVGPDEVRAATPDTQHVERKVALPDRWVRGLAEVPTVTAAMRHVTQLTGPEIDRLARALPRSAPPGPVLHLMPGPRGPRLLPRPLSLHRGHPGGGTAARDGTHPALCRDADDPRRPTWRHRLGLPASGRVPHAGPHGRPVPGVLRRGRPAGAAHRAPQCVVGASDPLGARLGPRHRSRSALRRHRIERRGRRHGVGLAGCVGATRP